MVLAQQKLLQLQAFPGVFFGLSEIALAPFYAGQIWVAYGYWRVKLAKAFCFKF